MSELWWFAGGIMLGAVIGLIIAGMWFRLPDEEYPMRRASDHENYKLTAEEIEEIKRVMK